MYNDILFHILIVADIEKVPALLLLNKYTHSLSKSTHYWYNRFEYHQLVMYSIPTVVGGWIEEFKKAEQHLRMMRIILKHAYLHRGVPTYKHLDTIALIPNMLQTLMIVNYILKNQQFDSIPNLTHSLMYFNLYNRPYLHIHLFHNHLLLDEFCLFYNELELVEILGYIIYHIPYITIKNGCGGNIMLLK